MRFLTLPFRNLVRRPIRSGLTASGIAIAVAAMVALIGLSQGLETAWTRGLMDRGTHILVSSEGAVEILTAVLEEGLIDKLAAEPEVSQADGELINLINVGSTPLLVAGWRPGGFLWQGLQLEKGRAPEPGEGNHVIIGRHLARRMNLEPGSTLEVLGRRFTVSGISKPSGALMGGTLTMPLTTMQIMAGRPGQVTVINLRLKNPTDSKEVKNALKNLSDRYPRLTFMETDQVTDNNRILSMLRITTLAISAVALIMGFFAVLNTLLMSVFERTWEIGVFSAVGWSANRILALVVLEGLIISTVGGAVGLGLGIIGINWLATLEAVSGFVEPEVGPQFLAKVFMASMAIGALGGLYPALWAARLKAVDALRHT